MLDSLAQLINAGGLLDNPVSGQQLMVDYSPEEIAYHLTLISEAGLLVDHARMMSGEFVLERLSVAGHDFVDSVRSPEIWAKTKKGAEMAGGFTIDLLKDLAKGFVKKQVEELTGVKL